MSGGCGLVYRQYTPGCRRKARTRAYREVPNSLHVAGRDRGVTAAAELLLDTARCAGRERGGT